MKLDEVCSRTEFRPNIFWGKSMNFSIGMVQWGVSFSVHKFLLLSKICTSEFQSQTFTADEESRGRGPQYKTMYYSSDGQDTSDMTGKALETLQKKVKRKFVEN